MKFSATSATKRGLLFEKCLIWRVHLVFFIELLLVSLLITVIRRAKTERDDRLTDSAVGALCGKLPH